MLSVILTVVGSDFNHKVTHLFSVDVKLNVTRDAQLIVSSNSLDKMYHLPSSVEIILRYNFFGGFKQLNDHFGFSKEMLFFVE